MGNVSSRVTCLKGADGVPRRRKVKSKRSNRAKKTADLIYVENPDRVYETSSSVKEDKESFVQHDSLVLNSVEDRGANPTRLATIPECDEHSTKTTNASGQLQTIAPLAAQVSYAVGLCSHRHDI